MKWFFNLDTDTLNIFEEMAKVAVHSALKNTTLEPIMLFNGDINNPKLDWFKNKNVRIVLAEVPFKDVILKNPDINKLDVALSAYLRVTVPYYAKQIGITDEYILYADWDLMFLQDLDFSNYKPEYIATVPGFTRGDLGWLNAGVILMNLKNMYNSYNEFINFIRNNYRNLLGLDEAAYNHFYGNKKIQLPPEYNWRPWWGIKDDVKIFHWHGPKPFKLNWKGQGDAISLLQGKKSSLAGFNDLFGINVEAYKHYVPIYEKFKSEC